MPMSINVGAKLTYEGGYHLAGVVTEIGNVCQEIVELDEDGYAIHCNRPARVGDAPACGHDNYVGYAKGNADRGGEFTVMFAAPLDGEGDGAG